MMTRKDYVAIAKAIAEARKDGAALDWHKRNLSEADAVAEAIAFKLAAHLAADNPRFDKARFIDACMGA